MILSMTEIDLDSCSLGTSMKLLGAAALTTLRHALLNRRPVMAALTITVGLLLFVLVLDLLVVPSLIALAERVLGHGFGIDMLLRIHFTYAFWILLLLLLVCVWVGPVEDPRARLVLFVLGIEILILLAIWVLDRATPFRTEASAVTFFTSVVLILTYLAALANSYLPKFPPQTYKLGRAFWTLLG